MPAITGRPRYLQVADDLRKRISDGTYPVGGELPSTTRLMELYGVSITVVRAAVRELRNEGLVLGQPGKAVYVQAEPVPADPSPEYIEIMDQLNAMRDVLAEFESRLIRVEEATGQHRPKGARRGRPGGRGVPRA